MDILKNYGVTELEQKEKDTVNGGMPWYLGILLGGLIYDVISDPGACIKGFKDGYNAQK